MATLYTQQSSNVAKTWFLLVGFLVFIIFLGLLFSYIFNNPVILYGAIIISLSMNLISYWYSDKIVLKMSGARAVSRDEFFDLYNITENLSITAGLPMPKIYLISDPVPNAFATGRNKDNAVVAVTSGLLEILNKAELEGVIAHELAHIGNRDILLQTIVVTLVGLVALLSDFFIRFSLLGGGRNRDDSRFGLIVMIIGIILALLSPLIASLIKLAISRKREFLADATGALLTRYPEGLASALEKLSNNTREMKKANNATAHLFIISPFGSKQSVGLHKWFMTHPPIEDRVKALRSLSL